MEIKNIPIYKNDMSENAPVANETLRQDLNLPPWSMMRKLSDF